VIELLHAVGDEQRVVIGERRHTGAEPDALCDRRGMRDEDLGRADDLVRARVVLADPRLVVAEASICWTSARSRWICSVGLSSSGWKGAMKAPKRSGAVIRDSW
jgi:hypothetical protein